MRNAFAMACFDLLSERAAIAVRIEDANNSRDTRLNGPAPGITGSGHRTHGGAVIGTIARNDFVAAGKEFRHFHGVFVRFSAAQCEKGFRQTSDLGELLAELAAWLGREARPREAYPVYLPFACFPVCGVCGCEG